MRLLPALVHAVGRCCVRISTCFTECFRDLASTTKAYLRDKTLGGGLDTSYLVSHPSTEGLYADSIEYVPSGYKALSAMLGAVRHYLLHVQSIWGGDNATHTGQYSGQSDYAP
jgi:hypothetical protein